MNNATLLRQALADGVTDDVTVSAALDAIREEEVWHLIDAVLEVADIVRASYDARQLAAAAEMIREGSRFRQLTIEVLRKETGTHFGDGANVVLCPGDAPPRATSHYRSNPGAWWYEWTVTVGASWLLAHVDKRRLRSGTKQSRRANDARQ